MGLDNKIVGCLLRHFNVERDNWEPRILKLDKSLALWKSRALCMIVRVFILNILGLSRLLSASRVLEAPRWVYARVNSLIWPFLWGSRIKTVARKSIICSTVEGGFRFEAFSFIGSSVPFCSSGQYFRRSLLQGLFYFEICLWFPACQS